MAEYNVTSTTQLIAVAKTAVAGDVIKVAPGMYSAVSLKYVNPTGNVTITSADPANPAVFTDLTVNSSSNLTFSNLLMQVQPDATLYYMHQVLASSNITLANNVFEGPGMTPTLSSTGLFVRNSNNVSVADSEFRDLVFGVSFLDNTGISVTNSTFHDIRVDGIRGAGNSQVYYGYNYFTDFHPLEGEHADAIQFWTVTTSPNATDILVEGNVVVRGTTGQAIQGIFMRDGYSLPFSNVTIKDNMILGGSYNGITLDGVTNGTVTGNTVIAFADQPSWIRTLNDGVDLNVFGNTATQYVTQIVETNDNALTSIATDGGVAALSAWSLTHKLAGDVKGWNDLFSLSGLSGTATSGGTTSTSGTTSTTSTSTSGTTSSTTTSSSTSTSTSTSTATTTTTSTTSSVLNGTSGNDVLAAKSGITEIHGAAGNDTISDAGFATKLFGDAGDDSYTVTNAASVIVESAGMGTDSVLAYVDHVLADNVENLSLYGSARAGTGNALDNVMNGTVGNDILKGLAGNDTLNGGDGDDLLDGGAGNDFLSGGAGNDRLIGGAGTNVFTGGAGNDVFVFTQDFVGSNMNKITDFARGYDLIDLSGIDAVSSTSANDAFRFIGNKGFSGSAGELHAISVKGGVMVEGDVNGDKIADFSIMVTSYTKMVATDFVL